MESSFKSRIVQCNLYKFELGFSADIFVLFLYYFCASILLYLYNILIIINFDILKYIKKIFKILIQCIFNVQQRIMPKKSIENMDSYKFVIQKYC